jgi:hypothetical protein
VGPIRFTRSGVIISAVIHGGALVLAMLFTGANPFDSEATEAMMVDIVSPSEAPPVPDDPWALPPEQSFEPPKPQFDMAALAPTLPTPTSPQSQPQANPAQATTKAQQDARRSESPASSSAEGQESGKAPSQQQQASPPPQQASPPPQQSSSTPPQTPPPQAQPPQAQPANAQPVQTPPQMKGAATDGGMGGDQGTDTQTNVANLFSMPLALPDGRLGGAFDAPAIEAAKIERSSIDAFRERIKSCAMLPPGISPSDRVSLVIRVALKPDGRLAGQPILIEASASPKGPALMQSLFAGLTKCQPFNMLPADKYQEWRSLDIRFTPQDLGQG